MFLFSTWFLMDLILADARVPSFNGLLFWFSVFPWFRSWFATLDDSVAILCVWTLSSVLSSTISYGCSVMPISVSFVRSASVYPLLWIYSILPFRWAFKFWLFASFKYSARPFLSLLSSADRSSAIFIFIPFSFQAFFYDFLLYKKRYKFYQNRLVCTRFPKLVKIIQMVLSCVNFQIRSYQIDLMLK